VMIFVFYRFEKPPVFFNQSAWQRQVENGVSAERLRALKADFEGAHEEEEQALRKWLEAKRQKVGADEARFREVAQAAHARLEKARETTKLELKKADPKTSASDSDYVFITFILDYLPHGLIGLLVAVFFAAALSSKAGELNALGSTTTVDFYRCLARRDKPEAHWVMATKWFTALWGVVAIAFALYARLAENLIQAVNILGSIFYGVVLGLFLIAFFIKWVKGTAAFWAALAAQALVFILYAQLPISYLWYNFIGCAVCVVLSLALQLLIDLRPRADLAKAS